MLEIGLVAEIVVYFLISVTIFKYRHIKRPEVFFDTLIFFGDVGQYRMRMRQNFVFLRDKGEADGCQNKAQND